MADLLPPDEHERRVAEGRLAVAEQIRRLHHALVGHEQDPDRLLAVAESLADNVAVLEHHDRRVKPPWTERTERVAPADGEEFPLDLDRPVSGPGNPWSLPTPVVRRGDRAETTVVLGAGYEGAPGRSHGGIVAAIFDDLCGFNLQIAETMAFTGWIRIAYRAATPLHVPITFSSWIDRREGRKLFIHGECRHDDQLLSTCESLFIEVVPERL